MMYVSLLLSFSQPSCYYELYRSGSEQYLGYLFLEARLVSGRDTRRCIASRLCLTHYFQGAVLGALMNMPLIDRFGLGTVSLKKLCYIFPQDSKFFFISCSWSALSSRLPLVLFNFFNFPFLSSFYPLVSVGLECHFRFVSRSH